MRLPERAGLIVLGIIFVFALISLSGFLRPLQDAGRWVMLPFVRGSARVGSSVNQILVPREDAATCREHAAELEARMQTLSVDYVRLRALEDENRALRSITTFLSDARFDYVAARVISRSADPQTAEVLIDRGAQDGLETGMAVVVGEGIFVGKITRLKEHVATVTFVTDAESRVAASRAGEHRLVGLIEGQGNNAARLTFIPQRETLARDEVIVTSGTEDKIPPNLSIGIINDISGTPTDPFKTAALEPLVRTDQLDMVAVLRSRALRPSS